jgi:predicted oxidoreductase
MNSIYLSDSGPKVSNAIYGFYRWGSNVTQPEVENIVNLCLELGINTFDHADIYGGYRCEELFGKAIAARSIKRENIVLFTKAGINVPDPSRPAYRVKHYDTSKAHIIESVNNSLKNLRTDYIDVFLLNQLDPLSNIEETAHTLQRLRESGKIKNIGIVNFSVFQHQLLASYLDVPIVTNHIELNLLNTTALDNGQVDYIKQRFMRPLATAPLAKGRISEGGDKTAIAVRHKLTQLAGKYNADIESLAVAWLLKLGALPLIGTTSEQRIRNIAASFSIDIDRQDWYELYAVSRGDLFDSLS